MISPTCTTLKSGFEGGYQFRRKQISGQELYEDRPLKNRFSHAHDALQYLLLGGGEGTRVLTGKVATPKKVSYAKKGGYDPFAKQRVRRHQRKPGTFRPY